MATPKVLVVAFIFPVRGITNTPSRSASASPLFAPAVKLTHTLLSRPDASILLLPALAIIAIP